MMSRVIRSGRAGLGHLEARAPAQGMKDLVTLVRKVTFQEVVSGMVIVDDQDGAAGRPRRARSRCLLRGLGHGVRAGGRQHDGKVRARTGRALDCNVAAQHLAELPGDRQAEPGAAIIA